MHAHRTYPQGPTNQLDRPNILVGVARTLAVLAAIALSHAASACDGRALLTPCPNGAERNENQICTYHTPKGDDRPSKIDTLPPDELPPLRCPEEPANVRLNELLIDPDGTDGGKEWLELEVLSPGRLDGMRISIRNAYLDTPSRFIPLVGRVEAGHYATVDDFHERSMPMGCESSNGCMKNSGGVVELLNCTGAIADSMDWGDASSSSRPVRSGYTLARCDSTGDWLQAGGSFGDKNGGWRDPLACPVDCSRPEWLVINEIFYDLVGADGGGEFIELYGPPNLPVDGLRVRGVNGSNGDALFTPIMLTGTTDDFGYYLIAGEDHATRDAALPTQLQNGPEALILEDCDGLRLDAITWGGHSPLLDEFNEGAPILLPGRSLSRYPDGAEGQGGMADFRGATPTPGWANLPD